MKKYSSLYEHAELMRRVREISHVVLDMDGTIYMGRTLFPFTLPFLELLKELGIGCSFLTNNPTKSVCGYLDKLRGIGIHATREQLYTSTLTTIDYLRTNHPDVQKLFLLGTPDMIAEFESSGFISTADDPRDEPDAVVAAFDMTLSYARLCRAAWWISRQKIYIATNPDRVCPTDQQTVLVDCGSICACLEHATGRKPDHTLGKPDPSMLTGILRRNGLENRQVAMVGDRIYTDITMAYNAGVMGILVLSGETTPETAKKADLQPHITVRNLEELGRLLTESHQSYLPR